VIHVEAYLPKDKRNVFNPRRIVRVQKIILHDPGSEHNAKQLINYFNDPKNTRPGSYHDIIEEDTVYHLIDHTYRAIHAGTFEYSMMWPEIGTSGTQNAYSLGVCITKGHFHFPTVAKYLEDACIKYDLDPFTDILCHYHLSHFKTDPEILLDYTEYKKLIEMVAWGAPYKETK